MLLKSVLQTYLSVFVVPKTLVAYFLDLPLSIFLKIKCVLIFIVTTEKPIQAQICQVKKSDRGDSYKKKTSWQLRELKLIDAKCTGSKVL